MLTEKDIVESGGTTTVSELSGRRYKVRLIEGDRLGSTGYYPASTLREYGPRVFTKGTPMYLDHMSETEKNARPHGSVLNYAAELAEDAYYENDGLYATVEVFEHQIPLIKSLKDKIGISVRARGHCVDEVINGQKVPVFKDFILARSADFVVRAGAGGKIVDMLESATEDSESASEEQEGREHMEKELLDALAKITEAQEQLAKEMADFKANIPVAEAFVEVVESSDEDILEIAEALAVSSLNEVGRKRVLDLHRANGKPLAELIEAEEAYVKKATEAVESAEGVEEEAVESAAENKPFELPARWATKKD